MVYAYEFKYLQRLSGSGAGDPGSPKLLKTQLLRSKFRLNSEPSVHTGHAHFKCRSALPSSLLGRVPAYILTDSGGSAFSHASCLSGLSLKLNTPFATIKSEKL